MGTDIHMVVQVKNKSGDWELVSPSEVPGADDYESSHSSNQWYGPRNYDAFAILANVRNGFGFAGCETGETNNFSRLTTPTSDSPPMSCVSVLPAEEWRQSMIDGSAAAYVGLVGMANAIHQRTTGLLGPKVIVPVTLVLHLEKEVLVRTESEEDERKFRQFYIEENHCLDNYIEDLHRECQADPGVCQTCHRGEAFVGHIKFEDISRLKTPNSGLAK